MVRSGATGTVDVESCKRYKRSMIVSSMVNCFSFQCHLNQAT
jgi:hypothetical protein